MTKANLAEKESHYLEIQTAVLKGIRGKSTTSVFSHRLGYKYNQYSRWEKLQKKFFWADFVTICQVRKHPLEATLARYTAYSGPSTDIPAFCSTLLESRDLKKLIKDSGINRFSFTRWRHGKGSPSFTEILRVMDCLGISILDFVVSLVDISASPKLATLYKAYQEQRQSVFNCPYLIPLFCSLGLKEYRSLSKHKKGFLAKRTGITLEQEVEALKNMEELGWIAFEKEKYVQLVTEMSIDVRSDRKQMAGNLIYWMGQASKALALKAGAPFDTSVIGYRTLTLSGPAYQEARKACMQFYENIMAITQADSNPKENCFVLNFALLNPAETPSE